jgi:hypothetical protein
MHQMGTFGFFPLLKKNRYKGYFWNISLFMRVRKRLDVEKIRKIGWKASK